MRPIRIAIALLTCPVSFGGHAMKSKFTQDFEYNHSTVINSSIASRFFQLMRQADRVQ